MRNALVFIFIILVFFSCAEDSNTEKTSSSVYDELSFDVLDINKSISSLSSLSTKFSTDKNIILKDKKDTLCVIVGLERAENFLSKDENGKEEMTFISKSGPENKFEQAVITLTGDHAYISSSFKGESKKIALFTTPQISLSNESAKKYNSDNAKGEYVYNADKTSCYFSAKNNKTDKQLSSSSFSGEESNLGCGVADEGIQDVSLPLSYATLGSSISSKNGGESVISGSSSKATGSNSVLYDYIFGNKVAYMWNSTIRYKRVGEIYVNDNQVTKRREYFRCKKDRLDSNFPVNRKSNEDWEFLGPYDWQHSPNNVGQAGDIYEYNNPWNKKKEFFRLNYWYYGYFPVNSTSNNSWEYLGETPKKVVTVKLWYQGNNSNTPISHEVNWAWNDFIFSMGKNRHINFVKTYQGQFDTNTDTGGKLEKFSSFLRNKFRTPEKNTIYGYLFWSTTDNVVGKAYVDSYFYGGSSSTWFPAFTAHTIGGANTMAHEIGHVLGAEHNNRIFYRKWWWIFGIWHRDIMSTASEFYVQYAEHKHEPNITIIRSRLGEDYQ